MSNSTMNTPLGGKKDKIKSIRKPMTLVYAIQFIKKIKKLVYQSSIYANKNAIGNYISIL